MGPPLATAVWYDDHDVCWLTGATATRTQSHWSRCCYHIARSSATHQASSCMSSPCHSVTGAPCSPVAPPIRRLYYLTAHAHQSHLRSEGSTISQHMLTSRTSDPKALLSHSTGPTSPSGRAMPMVRGLRVFAAMHLIYALPSILVP
jgi:hypothetical protein